MLRIISRCQALRQAGCPTIGNGKALLITLDVILLGQTPSFGVAIRLRRCAIADRAWAYRAVEEDQTEEDNSVTSEHRRSVT